MTLKKYQSKRQFDQTPEPAGNVKRSKGQLRFVVQKHAASHLHYDFRLEMDGVLKSWAIPKGPSLNPKDKRLAMQVEDHPMDYRLFEGTIPKGNYGAGNVIVWDEGTYEVEPRLTRKATEQLLLEGLEKGKLTFILHGQKLQGEFALVQMKGKEADTWLLLKHRDEFVSEADVTQQDRSVLTNRLLEDFKMDRMPKKNPTPTQLIKSKHKKTSQPITHEIKPMLATLVNEPFDRKGWIFEIKWDGYRAIAEIGEAGVSFYSRNLKSYEHKFPLVYQDLQTLQELGDSVILDGEVVALDEEGKASFARLQDYEHQQKHIVYYVFDLLEYNGQDLKYMPLVERKALLQKILPNLPRIKFCDHIEETGISFYQVALEKGLEGIIAKDGQSRYQLETRTDAWLKIKTHQRQEAIICGYTEPRGSRKSLGSLILGVYQDQILQYIGHTGTGMNSVVLKDLQERLNQLSQKNCPFKIKPKTNAPVHWVKPTLVCEVKFQEWTQDRRLRQPVFMGLREDKPAEQVMIETQQNTQQVISPVPVKTSAQKRLKQTAEVKLTHLDKIYWPEKQLTKGDLIKYYETMADFILPYLKDRPMSLHRYPNGIHASSFYQKDNPDTLPSFVKTAEIYSESNDKELRYLLCQNVETLLYIANLGCIELHPWNSRINQLDNPDYMVIDLDPGQVGFNTVIETALVVRDILKTAGMTSYCKTSGATGLHIYVPLGAQYEYEACKEFCHLVVTLVNKELPKTTTLERSLNKRPKKAIYLDYLQNRTGQTLASVFSVRPTVEASVSTPLAWDEVKPGLTPQQFTINNIPNQAQHRLKLWQPVLGKGIDLQACLSRYN